MSDAKTEAAAAPAPKGKPWLMVVVVLAALAVGAGGVMFYLGSQATKDATAEPAEKKKVVAPAQYVELDPPFVANFEAKGLMRFLQVTVEIMTRDATTVDLIRKNDPLIRNDLIMLFSSQRYEDISTREGKDKLRAAALEVVANAVTAEGGDGAKVEQLYFTSFVMQ